MAICNNRKQAFGFLSLWLFVSFLLIAVLHPQDGVAQPDNIVQTVDHLPVSRQQLGTRNLLYFEALGSGGLYSFNYEHLFSPVGGSKGSWALSFRTGFSIINGYVIPMTIHYYVRAGDFYYGVGAGITFYKLDPGTLYTEGGLYYGPVMGFRYMPTGKSYFIQLNYTPLLDDEYEYWNGDYTGTQVYYWGGIGFGLRV